MRYEAKGLFTGRRTRYSSFRLWTPTIAVIAATYFTVSYLSNPPAEDGIHSAWQHRLIVQRDIQKEFCRKHGMNAEHSDGVAKVKFIKPGTDGAETYDFFVYKDGDIVSTDILNSGSYEPELMLELAAAMDKAATLMNMEKKYLQFWDVGANLGTHIIYMSLLGYHGVAFEPMPANVKLLRTNLCANDPHQERVSLLNLGLSDKPATCGVYVPPGNKGDGVLSCPVAEDGTGRKGIRTDTYLPNGQVDVVRLDDLFFPPPRGVGAANDSQVLTPAIGALKMDVEGFEMKVVDGGRRFFTREKIPFIALEVWNLRDDDLRELLAFFGSLGYQMSTEGFFRGMRELPSLKDSIDLTKRYEGLQYGWKDMFLYHDGRA